MGTISFVAPGFVRAVTLPAGGPRRTLLAIARAEGIPILFNCEAGGCGACIVRVAANRGEPEAPGDDEALFLTAAGKFRDALESDATEGIRYRLACCYVVGDEDIVVDFTNELGSV